MRCAPRSSGISGTDRHGASLSGSQSVHGSIEKLEEDDFLHIIEKHRQQGVDCQTIHAGLLIELPKVKGASPASSAGWRHPGPVDAVPPPPEPLYTRFDDICEIFKRYDCTFSLGDSCAPVASTPPMPRNWPNCTPWVN